MRNQLTDHASDAVRRAISFNTLLNFFSLEIRIYSRTTSAKAMAS